MCLNPIPDKYKSDYLILLVGTNPLPNYVAARLLSREKTPPPRNTKTTIHLVVSNEMRTRKVDAYLAGLLKQADLCVEVMDAVNPSSPKDVFDKVKALVSKFPMADWGLNYTGGKKSMAVHAYRAMEQALAEQGNPGTYSYLDAETKEMVVQTKDYREVRMHVDLAVEVNWQQILKLHGRSEDGAPKEKPFKAEFGAALIAYCGDSKERWKQWKKFSNLLRTQKVVCKDTQASISFEDRVVPDWVPSIGGLTIRQLAEAWQGEIQALPDYQYALNKEFCNNEADWVRQWLHGKWLEDYVLAEVLKVKKSCNLHQAVGSLQVKGFKQFEVDVVVMRGYQLFAISTTTIYAEDEYGDKITKQKMFEAITRAHQMGGDEAKVALVALNETPGEFEKQVASQLTLLTEEEESSDQVNYLPQAKVFGIEHLPRLAAYLKSWFNN